MLAVGYVFIGEGINVFLCQPKVNDVDCVLIGRSKPAHQEVFRLHVAVDEVFAVHVLQSRNLESDTRPAEIGRPLVITSPSTH